MARNKHPEETVRKILDTASRLFFEKGYEKTSMQDIVKALGMSKGAIYHHFPSKEDLFEKVVTDFYTQKDWFFHIAKDPGKNGLEKLRALLRHEMSDEEKLSIDRLYFRQIKDPRVFMEHMYLNILGSAPMVAKIIEEGNRDGSCHVKYPVEAAEMMQLMTNVWLALFAGGREKFSRQFSICRQALESLGLPLLDDAVEAQMLEYYSLVLNWEEEPKPVD